MKSVLEAYKNRWNIKIVDPKIANMGNPGIRGSAQLLLLCARFKVSMDRGGHKEDGVKWQKWSDGLEIAVMLQFGPRKWVGGLGRRDSCSIIAPPPPLRYNDCPPGG